MEEALNKPIFGLDIGTFSIKVAEIRFKGNKPELYAASIINLPEPDKGLEEKNPAAVADCLRRAAKESQPKTISTKYVVSALPESKVYTEVLTMPEMSAEELNSAVPFEAAKHMPLKLNESYIDFSVSEKIDDKKVEVLVVAAPKKLVDLYQQLIRAAGMELLSLEIKPIAVARALLTEEMKKKSILILDIGAHISSVTILHHGNFAVAITASIGGEDYIAAVAKDLKIKREEALKMSTMAEKSEDHINDKGGEKDERRAQ